MKLPGRAWLEFEVTESEGKSTIRQTAIFDPVGLLGRAYWYGVYPLHQFVFGGMLRGIAHSIGKPVKSADGGNMAGPLLRTEHPSRRPVTRPSGG